MADGHGGDSNARIVKFDKEGKFIKAWGKKGSGPGEFDTPHGLVLDPQGRLLVADRGNSRIQVFDQEGRFITEWKQWGRPSGIALDRAGRLNVQDLLDGEGAQAEPGPKEPAPSRLGIALDRLEIEEARLVFEDASRKPAFQTTLGPLTIRLADFRTRGGGDSPYAFTGTTEAGETFSWSGTIHSDPLRSSGAIAFGGFKLPKYDPYSREQAPALFVESGTLSVDARYQLAWGGTARKLSLSDLKVVVEDLALSRRRDRSLALRLPRLEVLGGEVDLLAQVASIAEVKVLDARLRPRRDADGKLALVEMLETPPPRKDAPVWKWSVGTCFRNKRFRICEFP